jgi:hypothetical protein
MQLETCFGFSSPARASTSRSSAASSRVSNIVGVMRDYGRGCTVWLPSARAVREMATGRACLDRRAEHLTRYTLIAATAPTYGYCLIDDRRGGAAKRASHCRGATNLPATQPFLA